MSLISVQKISKSYYGRTLFHDLSFNLEAGDRLAILGNNGVGKTTLLKILGGLISPDEGKVVRTGCRIGYLEQNMRTEDPDAPVWQASDWQKAKLELEKRMATMSDAQADLAAYQTALHRFEALGGYDYEYNLRAALNGLGLADSILDRNIGSCSGGERMRVTLAKLLLAKPELLLLDEPTNHLDLQAIEWLIEYLEGYKGTICVVSHDRYFLDHLVKRCAYLSAAGLRIFTGNFTRSSETKKAEDALLAGQVADLSKEIEHQEAVAQTFLSHRNISGFHSREKLVNKLSDRLATLKAQIKAENGKLTFKFQALPDDGDPNRIIIHTENLAIGYGETFLCHDINLNLRAHEKIVLLGNNGTGKTTLMNVLAGRILPQEGKLKIAENLSVAYMSQIVEFPCETDSCLDTLLRYSQSDVKEGRNLLAQFGFKDIDVFKSVNTLSGGERCRLYLCCVLQAKPQLLFLDEPTNHLDIYSRSILEEAVAAYNGSVIVVSHDRYFIEKFANRFLCITGGKMIECANITAALKACQNHGITGTKSGKSYDDKASIKCAKIAGTGKSTAIPSPDAEATGCPLASANIDASKSSVRQMSPSTKRRLIANLKNTIKDLELSIERTESEIKAIEIDISPSTKPEEYEKLAALTAENEKNWELYVQTQSELDELAAASD